MAVLIASFALAAGATLTVGNVETVAEGFQFTEGPLWLNGGLIFSDIPADSIFRADKSVFRQPSDRALADRHLEPSRKQKCFHCLVSAGYVARDHRRPGPHRKHSDTDLAFTEFAVPAACAFREEHDRIVVFEGVLEQIKHASRIPCTIDRTGVNQMDRSSYDRYGEQLLLRKNRELTLH